MLYTFAPSHPGECAYAYPGGPLLASGDVVEMDAAQAARLVGIIEAAGGSASLVPVIDEASTPAPAPVVDDVAAADDKKPKPDREAKPKVKPRSK